jgi:hypothetical protein
MFSGLLGLITSIPSLLSGAFGTINNLTKAISNEKIAGIKAETEEEKIASAERVRTLELQRDVRIQLIGHPWEPEKLGFYVWLIFFAKCVIWDTVLGLGTTPELHGDVKLWLGLIVTYYFGKRIAETVFRK